MPRLNKLRSGHSDITPGTRAARAQDIRAWALKGLIALALLSGFLLSPKLWLSPRGFPLAPVSDHLPALPAFLNVAWFVVLVILLGAIAILPRPRRLIFVWVGLAALLSVWDQSRWQPWFYQYGFMLTALALYPWGNLNASPAERGRALNICRLIVAFTYIWSGLHKMNATFIKDVVPYLVDPFLSNRPTLIRQVILAAGPVIPLVELGVGLGLLTQRFRKPAVLIAAAMHVFVLLSIGPLGHNYNSVVWPWNVAMVFFVFILFWRSGDVSLKMIVEPRGSACHWAVLVLFGVMPLFHFLNLWDGYLSADLYSGTTATATINVSSAVRDRLPGDVQPYFVKGEGDRYEAKIFEWSMKELNAPVNPERRIFRKIANHFCEYATKPSDVILIIKGRPDLLTGACQSTQEDCSSR